jgi:ABC-type Fe3+/spermidine/putrescine transport system ATPase subunit
MPAEDRGVGFVFQDYALFPQMTASANVRFGLSGIPRAERNSEAMRFLDAVGLKKLANRRPSELSGGECQRLALARAVAPKPRVLLLDEPLASLDAGTAAGALDLIKQTVADLNVPCLLVTHDWNLASGHRTLRLEPGLDARIL